ncbi:RNA polymerase, sigma 54 subunit, RpoN/SigL [Filimonas lacunae]|uniref:RNA polymerase, sigma 54 subunit, RpoN/SigL n=1 Tax=Filimonas lacunae TaxID=477680 RepID=A0A173MEQ5_9BACT|nr:RNA polymerase factor sigma-54 [Filimonas lacunae]BAV06055.1 RNA polymerase sigma-54 factor RpoN [Filimonas lacunae]SIT24441.1 RNA polymerase, sigma 54 subunit, RpoN/SigL [Filimonas lacunae]
MINQRIEQKGQLKVLPQKIQFLNFLYLNRQELEMRIQNELIENPLLELKDNGESEKENDEVIADFKGVEEYMYDDIPDYKYEYHNYLPDNAHVDRPLEERPDFRADLRRQLGLLETDARMYDLAVYIIDSLNDYGMLDTDIDTLAEEYSFNQQRVTEPEQLEQVIKLLQTLDPPGIASFSVKDCLLTQLNRVEKKCPVCRKAIELMTHYYDYLYTGSFDRIMDQMQLDKEEFQAVIHYIAKLSPHPVIVTDSEEEKQQVIVPDVFVLKEGERFVITLNNAYSDRLMINNYGSELHVEGAADRAQKQAKKYIKSKTTAANWFISAVQQREHTLVKIMQAIVHLQRAYFEEGDTAQIKPMILKQVAELSGMDISTVSRATANKYAETEFGMVSLKALFTEGVHNTEGETISNRIIRDHIKDIIAGEDRKDPFTDQQITDALKKNGIMIARRTVTKYREQLQIPVAHLRKLSAQIQH